MRPLEGEKVYLKRAQKIRTVLNGMILLTVFGIGSAATVHAAASGKSPRTEIRLSGAGWKLWRDAKAQWDNDELFPPPVDISKLPVNPPTGGWPAMYSGGEAISVSVPGTVEEYFWDDIHGNRKTDESTDLGDYLGVSWWWRTLDVPASAKGKRILIKFESNGLRSDEIDITDAVKPGEKNTLAVRVTEKGRSFFPA